MFSTRPIFKEFDRDIDINDFLITNFNSIIVTGISVIPLNGHLKYVLRYKNKEQ